MAICAFLTAFTNRRICALLRHPTPRLHRSILPAAHSYYNTLQGNLSTFKIGPSTTRNIFKPPILPLIAKPSSVFIHNRMYSPFRYIGVVIIPRDTTVIIERLKTQKSIVTKPGVHFFLPIIERVAFSQYTGRRYVIVHDSPITKDGFDVTIKTTLEVQTIDVILASYSHNGEHELATKNKASIAVNARISITTMENIISGRAQITHDIMVQLTGSLRSIGIACINCHLELANYRRHNDEKLDFQNVWPGPSHLFIQWVATISFATIMSWLGGLLSSGGGTGMNGGNGPHPNGSAPNGKGANPNGKGTGPNGKRA